MGSIVKGLFGGGKTSTTTKASSVPITYSRPRNITARIGGRNMLRVRDGGNVTLAGSRDVPGAFRRTQNSITAQRGRVGGMISDLRSNMNPFIQARVRPLEAALENTVADTSRGLARRGVFGSLSLNEVNNARFLGEQAVADERAKATDEALGALFDAETLTRGLNQDEMSLAETMMRDELARLGISLEAIQLALGDQKQMNQVAGGTTTLRQPTDILGGIGRIIGIGNALGG